jgi:hypothetical protein
VEKGEGRRRRKKDKGGDGKGWVRGRDPDGNETLGTEEMRGRGDDGERRMKEY